MVVRPARILRDVSAAQPLVLPSLLAYPRRLIQPVRLVEAGGLGVLGFGLLAFLALASWSDLSVLRSVPEPANPVLLVAVALCAVAFDIRGGVAAAVLALGMATSWLLLGGMSAADYAAEAIGVVAIGALAGWFVAQRRALVSTILREDKLAADLILEAGFNGEFRHVNPAWRDLLGYRPDELVGRPLLAFIHPDDQATTRATLERQKADVQPRRCQSRFQHKNGSYRWLEWNCQPDSSSHTLIAVARDITDRKRLEVAEQTHKERLEQEVEDQTKALRTRSAELERSRLETLQRLALAVAARDRQTHQHTNRVGEISALIARQLDLPQQYIEQLRHAAPLHDIGKIAIRDTVLLKKGRLTDTEFEHVKTHTTEGAAILGGSDNPVLQLAQEIALSHHENYDGSGYPQQLHDSEIPLAARIVAIADTFDALISERPYKTAWALEQALTEIARQRGRRFDPLVLDAFQQLGSETLADGNKGTQATTITEQRSRRPRLRELAAAAAATSH
jgi:PAS domain S-box-containing protein